MGEKMDKNVDSAPEKGVKKKRGRKIIPVLLVIIVALAGYWFYNLTQSANYYETENAKVTAKMYYITGVTSGELIEWQADLGQDVSKGSILGRQSVLPYITSPIDGTIVVNNAVEGQLASPSTQLAVVADTEHQYIGVNVEETDISKIKIGQKAEVVLDAYPNTVFEGLVADIDLTTQTYFSGAVSFSTSGTFTKVTQLVPIKIYIENPDELALTFGMNATVKVLIHDEVAEENITKAKAMSAPSETTRLYTTTVSSKEQINVISSIAGKVANVFVSVGDSVAEGDILFELDKTDRELLYNQAKANYTIALANYESTKTNFDSKSSVTPTQVAYTTALDNYSNTKALYEAGSVSKSVLDAAEAQLTSTKAQLATSNSSLVTALETASAQVDAASASLAIAEKNLADCEVKAPISGEIALSNINVGDMISSQITAMSIVDAGVLEASINVTETQIANVSVGDAVNIKVVSSGGVLSGRVSTVAPASNPTTGTFEVVVEIQNNGNLKPGMVVELTLE